jgi:NAD(P)H-hydrate epimerase
VVTIRNHLEDPEVPAITAAQMLEIDRSMIEDLHIELVQMMENAGRHCADLAVRRFQPTSVCVLAGSGGNGGGGLVAARHLANRGVAVHVVLSSVDELAPVPAHQLDIVRRMQIDVLDEPEGGDLVIDALIGYSLRGDPTGRAAELIAWTHKQPSAVLALDTPSGLDVTTGRAADPCVHATATMTLALPKLGLRNAPEVGNLYVADISVPPSAFRAIGIDVPWLFAHDAIIEVPTQVVESR